MRHLMSGSSFAAGPQQELPWLAESSEDIEALQATRGGPEGAIDWPLNRSIGPLGKSKADDESLTHNPRPGNWDRQASHTGVTIPIHQEGVGAHGGDGVPANKRGFHSEIGQPSSSYHEVGDSFTTPAESEEAGLATLGKDDTRLQINPGQRAPNADCPICMVTFDPSASDLPARWDCGHRYHHHCINSWLWAEKWKTNVQHNCLLCHQPLSRKGVKARAPISPPLSLSEDADLRRALHEAQIDRLNARTERPSTRLQVRVEVPSNQQNIRSSSHVAFRSSAHSLFCYDFEVWQYLGFFFLTYFIFRAIFKYTGDIRD
ncbi:hypothetical protein MJO29_013823 [Puccinia striiformis f. sp. tritici]|nr:hypothetical protein MJO29_013823 [Puccinia striiformis f. sp. tritici]